MVHIVNVVLSTSNRCEGGTAIFDLTISNLGRIQDSPGQGDNLINWYIEYPYQNNFVRKVPLTVQGYQVVPREQIFVSIGDIL